MYTTKTVFRKNILGTLAMGAFVLCLCYLALNAHAAAENTGGEQSAPQNSFAPASEPEAAARREYFLLLREKAFWEAMLEEDPCTIQAFFMASGTGAARAVEDPPTVATPEVHVPGQNATSSSPALPRTKPLGQAALNALNPVQRVEFATVLLLCPQDNGLQQGSGFFINKNHVLTNLHVVNGAYPDKIFVSAPVFGGTRMGRVVAASTDPMFDFAVIQVSLQENDVTPPLSFTRTVNRADKVGAWGYPALVSELDPAYQRLLHGDLTAVPEVIYTEGTVNALLPTKPRSIVHSAVLSQGNSGGPLVNEKGAVVGINTFIRMDSASNRQAQAALASDAIMDFLQAHKIAYSVQADPPSKDTALTPVK